MLIAKNTKREQEFFKNDLLKGYSDISHFLIADDGDEIVGLISIKSQKITILEEACKFTIDKETFNKLNKLLNKEQDYDEIDRKKLYGGD